MIKGLFCALVTPFDSKGKIDYKCLKILLTRLIDLKIEGVLINGTSGEGNLLTFKEQLELVSFCLKIIKGKMKLMVGVIESSTKLAIKKVKIFSKEKIDYLLVSAPFYLKTSDKGIYKHFKLINDASNKPLLIYHNPLRGGNFIDINVLKRLKNLTNIIGIKEASGDVNYFKSVVELKDESFSLMLGNDNNLIDYLDIPFDGLISAASNVYPKAINDILNNLKENREYAQKLIIKYQKIFKLIYLEPNPILVKYALKLLDYKIGGYRLPLLAPSKKHKALVREEMKALEAKS